MNGNPIQKLEKTSRKAAEEAVAMVGSNQSFLMLAERLRNGVRDARRLCRQYRASAGAERRRVARLVLRQINQNTRETHRIREAAKRRRLVQRVNGKTRAPE